MPILGIIKVIAPKTLVKNDTLSPPAIIPVLTPSIDSILSKAIIIPKIEPKKPNTKPKRLTSEAKLAIFLDFGASLLRLTKPITTKNKASNKHIKIKDIKKGPPSLNLSAKTFNAINDKINITHGFN